MNTSWMRRSGLFAGVAGAREITALLAAFSLLLSAGAYAQTEPATGQAAEEEEADDENVETVVVTGIRAAIESAITIKKEAGQIVEAISAEDIGKLPDTSIADSISRLPGLTSQRAEGRASAISLRGTDPGFTTALMNGREQVSTGDNRSIEFDQYPSELLSAVVVYKTPDVALVGQGLAGTIDLRTTRPLDYNHRAMVLNIRGEQNSHDDLGADADEQGYRASFSYIDQFADGRFGITFGLARLESPLATQGAGTYEPWHPNGNINLSGSPNPNGVANPGVAPENFITNGIKVRTDMGKNRRDGAMAALQWRPSDTFQSVLDLYYTKREQEDNARSLEVNLGDYPAYCCDGTFPDGTVFGYANPVVRNNTVVQADLINRVPLARNFLFKTEDEIVAAGWNNAWTGTLWRFSTDVSYSEATRDEEQYETNAQYAPDPNAPPGAPRNVYDNGTFSLTDDGMPTLQFGLDYADPENVQVGPTIYGAGYSKIPHVTDKLTSGRIDIGRFLSNGWLSEVAVGVNYADREKDKFQPEGGLSTIGNGYFQVAPEFLLSPTNLGYASAGGALAWDVMGVLGEYYQPIVYGTPTTPGFDYLIGKNWTVEEKVTTGYVRAALDRELSDTVSLRGNLGVQLVYTDQSSDATRQIPDPNDTDPGDGNARIVVPFSEGKSYTDVLPAINLAFLLPDQQAVRLALSREVARARMDQLKASSENSAFVQSGGLVPQGNGGNPLLDPWRANAFDVSYEKYFGSSGYISFAAFYKDLKTYIYNQTDVNHDFSDFMETLPYCFSGNLGADPDDPSDDVCPPVASTVGNFNAPQNGKGGNLKGIEIAVSLPGDLLSDSLDGFGAIVSFAQTDSSIRIDDPPGNNFLTGNGLGNIPLPGLSETVWNATLYYEKAGFSARVATRARSKYIGEVTNFANDRALKYVKGDQITDAQIGYAFAEGTVLEGLSILFQVNNLTDEPYIAYAVEGTRQQDYQEYGRQYLLGINYKL